MINVMNSHQFWPTSVWVLTRTDQLQGGPGCDLNNNPLKVETWVQRELYDAPIFNTYSHAIIYQEWMKVFNKIKKRHIKKTPKLFYSLHDAYNATWAHFGYTENQCPSALALLQKFNSKTH